MSTRAARARVVRKYLQGETRQLKLRTAYLARVVGGATAANLSLSGMPNTTERSRPEMDTRPLKRRQQLFVIVQVHEDGLTL